jgi:hypothetical protein
MSEPFQDRNAAASGRLAEAIREVKNAYADRDDVVVDIREAQLTRLEMLADDLKAVFSDIPRDDERFDLAISAGSQPRLWIDAVSHVTMGRDRRTYRFLRDTRLGRVVQCETPDLKTVAEQVTRYVAGRMIERQRALEGDVDVYRTQFVANEEFEDEVPETYRSPLMQSIIVIVLGGLVGAGLIFLLSLFLRDGGTF